MTRTMSPQANVHCGQMSNVIQVSVLSQGLPVQRHLRNKILLLTIPLRMC